ncbi:MAG TPA: bifunctional 4-hydroxy-2-oxoglutarate aldolase/2-dehydro-3-deoxy-phosphogluconate aldolase [Sporolactobacillaceae bacterium]|nr:bifunctional 4-hydroxy-2-oxoglutarate aldolase/2-dehydro-3-deoxy-phosphogluconate aldolase [Sporolactobacillaceae bacterium]
MDKQTNLRRLIDSGLVAVVRRPKAEYVHQIIEALVDGGVGALELTVDTPGVYELIREFKEKYAERVLVGAGTVLDAVTAKTAIEAGADFIFSPILDRETIQVTNEYGRISIPGVMTPTEIVNGYKAGADLLKIFPGNSLGVNYIKELQGPLGHIPVMPTGGVTLDNVEAFIKNGAVAVGVGGSLVNKKVVEEGRFDVLKETAQEFVTRIKRARGEK